MMKNLGLLLFIVVVACGLPALAQSAPCIDALPDALPDAQAAVAPVPVPRLAPRIRAFVWGASWCAPCRQLHPLIEKLRGEGWDLVDKSADDQAAEFAELGIVALPTIQIGESNGKELARRTGLQSIEQLREWFKIHGVRRLPPSKQSAPEPKNGSMDTPGGPAACSGGNCANGQCGSKAKLLWQPPFGN